MAIDYTKRGSAPASATATATPAVSLRKVTLTKSQPKVSLSKQSGHLRVNLNWTAQQPAAQTGPGGFLRKLTKSTGIDLDLGCLYELTDGRKGVVQALGNAFGSLDAPPYIQLNGDDRSGADVGGENMLINLAQAQQIRRVLVFACIYAGVPSFDLASAVVTLEPASGPPIEVHLDESAGGARMCAIALIEGTGGELSVRREIQYIQGAQDALDRAYGWGLNWSAGRK
jgi:tellurite resistance protein TerA